MESRVFLLAMILSLILSANALAQEKAEGMEVSIAPRQSDLKGNRAKFNEYRDLRDGVRGHISFREDAGGIFFDFRADDIGYRDQKFEMDGGRRGSFRVNLGYDEIPHNFTFHPKVRP